MEEKQRLKKAKADFQEGAKSTLSMKLDCPDSHKSGGNSDTATMARRFLPGATRSYLV
jgi:hypothetical protein